MRRRAGRPNLGSACRSALGPTLFSYSLSIITTTTIQSDNLVSSWHATAVATMARVRHSTLVDPAAESARGRPWKGDGHGNQTSEFKFASGSWLHVSDLDSISASIAQLSSLEEHSMNHFASEPIGVLTYPSRRSALTLAPGGRTTLDTERRSAPHGISFSRPSALRYRSPAGQIQTTVMATNHFPRLIGLG